MSWVISIFAICCNSSDISKDIFQNDVLALRGANPPASRGIKASRNLSLNDSVVRLVPPLPALLTTFSRFLLLLAGLLLSAALLLARLLLPAALLLLSGRPLVTLLLTLLLIAALIVLNIFVRISHLKYLIVKSQRPARNYELAHYNYGGKLNVLGL